MRLCKNARSKRRPEIHNDIYLSPAAYKKLFLCCSLWLMEGIEVISKIKMNLEKKKNTFPTNCLKLGFVCPTFFLLLRAIQLVCNYKFFVKRCEVFRYCHMNKAKTHIRHDCFATSCNSLRKINFMNAKRYQISGKDFEFYIVIVERKVNDYLLDCIQCLCD